MKKIMAPERFYSSHDSYIVIFKNKNAAPIIIPKNRIAGGAIVGKSASIRSQGTFEAERTILFAPVELAQRFAETGKITLQNEMFFLEKDGNTTVAYADINGKRYACRMIPEEDIETMTLKKNGKIFGTCVPNRNATCSKRMETADNGKQSNKLLNICEFTKKMMEMNLLNQSASNTPRESSARTPHRISDRRPAWPDIHRLTYDPKFAVKAADGKPGVPNKAAFGNITTGSYQPASGSVNAGILTTSGFYYEYRRYIFPIPESETSSNPTLAAQQNSGW